MWAKHWRLALILVVQLAILAAIPLKQIRARAFGTPIVLRTMPVDPYDPMAGYYVTLAYEVEDAQQIKEAERATYTDGDTIWLLLRKGDPAWTLVARHRERPTPGPDEVVLKATWRGWRAEIVSAGRFYIPETQRDIAAQKLGMKRGKALVDMMVGADGVPALLHMRVGGHTFSNELQGK